MRMQHQLKRLSYLIYLDKDTEIKVLDSLSEESEVSEDLGALSSVCCIISHLINRTRSIRELVILKKLKNPVGIN